jgi:hypothetical protein
VIRVPIVSSFNDRGFRDADRALARLEQGGGALGRWAGATRTANKATEGLDRALAGIAGVAVLATRAASDQEQALGALDAVFKTSAPKMEKWATTQKQIGLSTADAANQAAYLGSMLKGAGASTAAAADQSQRLVGLGADLAATYGGSTADAVRALGAAMRGEFDPLERFGISIKQSDVNAALAAKGLDKLTGEAGKQARAVELQALIWEASADAQGQAARESDSVAAATARASASIKDAGASLAEDLLPPAARAADTLARVVDWMGRHPAVAGALIAALVAIRTALLLNQVIIATAASRTAALTIATRVATIAQWLWNAAMTSNPIGIVIGAVALLVTAIVILWKKNETFRDAVLKMWSAIRYGVGAVVDQITGHVGTLIDWFKRAWEWIQRIRDSAGAWLDRLPFRASPAGIINPADGRATSSQSTVNVGQIVWGGGTMDGRTLRNMLEAGDMLQGRPPGAPRRVAW